MIVRPAVSSRQARIWSLGLFEGLNTKQMSHGVILDVDVDESLRELSVGSLQASIESQLTSHL